jgi:pilus assembly protein Flp/PilA
MGSCPLLILSTKNNASLTLTTGFVTVLRSDSIALSLFLLASKEVLIMLYLTREEGQGLLEYALVLLLISVVVIAILVLLGPQIGNLYSRVSPCVTDLNNMPDFCL